jgi:hypothetical protein
MQIVFVNKADNTPVLYQEDYFINNEGNVYRDNLKVYESQSKAVSLSDFIEDVSESVTFVMRP